MKAISWVGGGRGGLIQLGVQRDLRGRYLHTKGGEEADRGWTGGGKQRGEEVVDEVQEEREGQA